MWYLMFSNSVKEQKETWKTLKVELEVVAQSPGADGRGRREGGMGEWLESKLRIL